MNASVNAIDILGLCGNKTLTIGESFQKLWNSKSRIANDIKKAFDNSHPALKIVIGLNATKYAVPLIAVSSEAVATTVILHPIESTAIAATVEGYFGGNSPSKDVGTLLNGIKSFGEEP